MSLDVYLTVDTPQKVQAGSGIFVRENGQTLEISAEEWDRRFPDREPVVVRPVEEYAEVFSWNITHNLNRMADEAGVYDACWRPFRVSDPEAAKLVAAQEDARNYHGHDGAFALERAIVSHARDLIQPLRDGLATLQTDPERFKAFNPENGWGNYEGLVAFVAAYLAACERWPDAKVEVSR